VNAHAKRVLDPAEAAADIHFMPDRRPALLTDGCERNSDFSDFHPEQKTVFNPLIRH
jgi:hypothetical protein